MVCVELALVIMASPAFLAWFKGQVCSQESGVGSSLGTRLRWSNLFMYCIVLFICTVCVCGVRTEFKHAFSQMAHNAEKGTED